jgi:transketolase
MKGQNVKINCEASSLGPWSMYSGRSCSALNVRHFGESDPNQKRMRVEQRTQDVAYGLEEQLCVSRGVRLSK